MKIEKMKVSEVSDKTLVNYLKSKGYTIKQSNNNSNSNKLPKTWEELGKISGHYIDGDSFGWKLSKMKTSNYNKNAFRTKEQAEAVIALAQLSQLMFVYNKGWTPNWEDIIEEQYCIEFRRNILYKSESLTTQHFLAFKMAKTRDKFLKNFKDLIWQAKPLL